MAHSTDTTTSTEHCKNLRDHFERIRLTGRPLYIVADKFADSESECETDAVLLSTKAYDALADKARILDSLAMLDRSMDDIQEGRTHPAKAALKKLAEDRGRTLDR